jgi:hypothetical protein
MTRLVSSIDVPRWHLSNQNEKHTSQPLTAARIALRLREHLELPGMKRGVQVTLKQRREMTLFIKKRPCVPFDVFWTLFGRGWQMSETSKFGF